MPASVNEDRPFSVADVQALDRPDALAAFFAALGYDTETRLTQTVAAMGITSDSLTRKVRRIERLASQDQGALQVYLVELDLVTVAATRALARAHHESRPQTCAHRAFAVRRRTARAQSGSQDEEQQRG